MTFTNPQELGKSVKVYDEGVLITSGASSIDLVGAGVTGTSVGGDVTMNIPGGSGAVEVRGEVPTGTVDGNNKDFVIANTPISGTLTVYVGGSRQKVTTDYTFLGTTISFITAPMVDSIVICDYQY
jgi:hypothetical protein